MQRRKRIGFDFDDVLYDFNSGLFVFHNEKYGTSYTLKDVTRYDFKELWQCDEKEALRRMKEFVRSEYHDRALPIEGAVEAVTSLELLHDLYVITARDENLAPATERVSAIHFPDRFKGIHYLHRNDINVLGTKGDVCLSLEIDLMVEDSLGNAEHLSQAGIRTLLFDRPWNQTPMLPQHVTRVFGWGHAQEQITLHFSKG